MSRNVGREDRVVRACVALSLLLMGGFAVAASGEFGAATIGFAILAGYFVLTAAVGWDPLYAWQRIDTRVDRAEPGGVGTWSPETAGADLTDAPPVEIDLREPRLAHDGQAGSLGDS
jgi:hypothetical protein